MLRENVEQGIWSSRFLVMIAVGASLLTASALFIVGALDTATLLHELVKYVRATGAVRDQTKYALLIEVAENVDGFLFATVLLMFALGLYELFISRIHVGERETFSEMLVIHSVDDLKNRLSKVLFLILFVRYFEFALRAAPTNLIETLQFTGGIVLAALALFLTSRK